MPTKNIFPNLFSEHTELCHIHMLPMDDVHVRMPKCVFCRFSQGVCKLVPNPVVWQNGHFWVFPENAHFTPPPGGPKFFTPTPW
jgi:hypothetical protein